MAIQINTALTTRSGIAVASGAYCALHIKITQRKQLEIDIRFYKNSQAFDDLKDPIWPDNAGLLFEYTRQLTNTEYQNFTNIAVHQFVQTYLETIFGPGTTQLVQ